MINTRMMLGNLLGHIQWLGQTAEKVQAVLAGEPLLAEALTGETGREVGGRIRFWHLDLDIKSEIGLYNNSAVFQVIAWQRYERGSEVRTPRILVCCVHDNEIAQWAVTYPVKPTDLLGGEPPYWAELLPDWQAEPHHGMVVVSEEKAAGDHLQAGAGGAVRGQGRDAETRNLTTFCSCNQLPRGIFLTIGFFLGLCYTVGQIVS